MITEKPVRPLSGWLPLLIVLCLIIGGPVMFVRGVMYESAVPALSGVAMFLTGIISCFGFMAIAPNSARVLLLFGKYVGSAKDDGFCWVNPFYSKKKLSLRVRNFETGSTTTPEVKNEMGKVVQESTRSSGKPSKVNDRDGNPIDISAVVVWKVVDTAEALFDALASGTAWADASLDILPDL